MTPEAQQSLASLMNGRRVLSLGVLVDGAPHVGLLPFALSPDGTALLVHASALAKHSRGLAPGAPFSALLHEPDGPDADPLEIPRVTVDGIVEVPEEDSPAWEAAKGAYVARFPEAEPIFQLGDFTLYALRIDRGRLVMGFGSTANLRPEHFRALAG